jgi:hypothetical protein
MDQEVAESYPEIERAKQLAQWMSHPHTQLTGILKDVQSPTSLDVNGRVGILQQALARLTQILLSEHEAPQHPDAPGGGIA